MPSLSQHSDAWIEANRLSEQFMFGNFIATQSIPVARRPPPTTDRCIVSVLLIICSGFCTKDCQRIEWKNRPSPYRTQTDRQTNNRLLSLLLAAVAVVVVGFSIKVEGKQSKRKCKQAFRNSQNKRNKKEKEAKIETNLHFGSFNLRVRHFRVQLAIQIRAIGPPYPAYWAHEWIFVLPFVVRHCDWRLLPNHSILNAPNYLNGSQTQTIRFQSIQTQIHSFHIPFQPI